MTDNDITGAIVDAAYHVHTRLGPGLLESVYEAVLAYELAKRGLDVQRQVPIAIGYDELRFDIGFRADLLIEGRVIVELKSVERVLPVHKKQALTYIKLADVRVGLLLNFGAERIHSDTKWRCGAPEGRPKADTSNSFRMIEQPVGAAERLLVSSGSRTESPDSSIVSRNSPSASLRLCATFSGPTIAMFSVSGPNRSLGLE